MIIRVPKIRSNVIPEEELNRLLKNIYQKYEKPDIVLVKNAISFVRRRLASRELGLVSRAYDFSKRKHDMQKRYSGEPYFNHLISTALILSEYEVDAKTISAALLHDILEDTNVQKEDLEKEFGKEIANVVEALTKANKEKRSNEPYMQKLLLSACTDMSVLTIKIADKLHNLRTIEALPKGKKIRICKQAFEFYAPLAELIGMKKAAEEMREICISVLWPKEYKELKERLSVEYTKKELEVDEAISILNKKIGGKPFRSFSIKKAKKPFSHYFQKIREGKILEELYDFFYIVISAKSKDDCYLAMKMVHESFHPIPRKFKDYIATPAGSYKALHTSVIGPSGNPIKVYIMTNEVYEIQERSAGWFAKSKKKQQLPQKIVWLAHRPKEEFEEAIAHGLKWQDITIFDSKGKPSNIPKGSTVIDFAFEIEPTVAENLIAAKIHGKFVPLSTELKHADRVELFFAEEKQIRPEWLRMAKLYETKKKIGRLLAKEKAEVDINF
ncbi:MAG: HD domain-containing protein [Candidatus Diapherotrites archaeon]|nr:HD domain-containing protein [Candidatus Diapherotrites archaeon]